MNTSEEKPNDDATIKNDAWIDTREGDEKSKAEEEYQGEKPARKERNYGGGDRHSIYRPWERD